MRLDEEHPMNGGVLRHFRDRKLLQSGPEPLVAPDRHPDPYMQAGSHPDIVERVWDTLGSTLPADCRALVYGTPALVHPVHGVVLALAYGTQYAIRVPNEAFGAALDAGCTTEQTWTGGGKTRIEKELGVGWVFGCWADEEEQWLARMYQQCAVAT
jgi:hypothetical protein